MKVRKILVVVLYVLAVLLVMYGLFVRAAASGTKFYLIWILMGICAVALGVCLQTKIWDNIPNVLKIILYIGIGASLCVIIFTQALVISGFKPTDEKNLDYIIVLGAQVKEKGPSLVLRHRLDSAYDYLNKNPKTKCIVSGGQGSNEPTSEAKAMKDYLVDKGIDADRIIMEDKSVNTSQNIQYSSAFLDKDKDSVGIVTNNFHVYRGTHLAIRAGFKNVYGIPAPSEIAYLPNNMFRESFGIIKDFALKRS